MRTFAIAGAVVLALVATTASPASANAAPGALAAAEPSTVALADAEMMVSGELSIRTLKRRLITRIRRWVIIIICFGDTTTETTTEEQVVDNTINEDVTDFFEETRTIDEFYDEGYALVDQQQSSTGMQFVGSSGGGGGDSCITGSGPSCEYQY